MEVFAQQLINGLTLGSIYGLIAIGYTMVFGIIGMVNFAHGDVFMLSAFIALIFFLMLTTWLGIGSAALALFIVLLISMALTALWGWAIERVAYRPLRGSFRLAPLISAIGVSIFLANFVQVAQGARNKPTPPMVRDVIVLVESAEGYAVALSYKQIIIMAVTAVLLAVFWYLVQKTPLGRAQRACEQDRKMAAPRRRRRPHDLAHLRDRRSARRRRRHHVPSVLWSCELRGWICSRRQGVHGGRSRRHRLAARRRARRAHHRPRRDAVVGLFLDRIQGRGRLLDPRHRVDLHAFGHPRPARSRKGLAGRRWTRPGP